MPEGPEVQTIVNALAANLKGRRIAFTQFVAGAELKMIAPWELSRFRREVIDQTVAGIVRRGKYIDIELSSGLHLVLHLLMTGQLILQNSDAFEETPRFLRCVLGFDNGTKLFMADKSTWLRIVPIHESQLSSYRGFLSLGVDVLSQDFSVTQLERTLIGNTKIHSLLLDQTKISGLGNIYVNECLFHAGIFPMRKASSLSEPEVLALFHAIRNVAREALRQRGTTFSDYRTASGEPGNYQNFLKVFKRAKQRCTRCGATIRRTKAGGRSVFYCPTEQAMPLDNSDSKPDFNQRLPFMQTEPNRNFIFVLTGPSSAGKTTLSRAISKHVPFVELVPTIKTRKRRPKETDADSIFMTKAQFQQLQKAGSIILAEEIHGNLYGTLKTSLDDVLASGKDVCIILSPVGAQELRLHYSNVFVISVLPPTIKENKSRAKSRPDYSDEERTDRVANLEDEFTALAAADFTIATHSEDQALRDAFEIVYSVRCSTGPSHST